MRLMIDEQAMFNEQEAQLHNMQNRHLTVEDEFEQTSNGMD